MTKQHKRTWQRHEQRVAQALGTQRTGNQGAATADVVSADGWLVVECKSWRRLPVSVVGALEQAERAARRDQLPIAVLHQVGARSAHDLVVMRWSQFQDWFGGERPARLSDLVDDLKAKVEAGDEEALTWLRILAPDTLTDGTDEQEALHSHLCGLWGE